MLRCANVAGEIQGMVIADPYSFNDAFPTDERRSRKPNKRRYQIPPMSNTNQYKAFLHACC